MSARHQVCIAIRGCMVGKSTKILRLFAKKRARSQAICMTQPHSRVVVLLMVSTMSCAISAASSCAATATV